MTINLYTWIERQAAFYPDKIALTFHAQTLSYAALCRRIDAAASALRELGISQGKRLGYLGLNHPDQLVLLFACAREGALLVPLNWRLAAPEVDYLLNDADVDLLLCGPEFCDTIAPLRHSPAHQHRQFLRLGSAAATDNWPGFDELLNHHYNTALSGVAPADSELPLLIVYTSGTTGHPKGALLTQSALFWNVLNSIHMHDLSRNDRVLNVLPMFHVGGLNIQVLPALATGATVLLHERFDPGATLAAIANDRPDLVVLVPATLSAIIEHPNWQDTDLSSLRCVTTGSSPIAHHLISAFHDRGVPMIQVYGATETAPVAVYQVVADAERKLGSCGKPGMYSRVRVIDDSGEDLPPGQSGEVLIGGGTLLQGYWRNPQASTDALRDGWFYSGDIGHFDDDGFLYIDDRKKDVIISGGENIYPAELELLLSELAGVAGAAVIGATDARWGEVPVAVIERTPDTDLDEACVFAAFDGRLARFKHPRRVVFVDALPRNAMGKVQKQVLRDGFQDEEKFQKNSNE